MDKNFAFLVTRNKKGLIRPNHHQHGHPFVSIWSKFFITSLLPTKSPPRFLLFFRQIKTIQMGFSFS